MFTACEDHSATRPNGCLHALAFLSLLAMAQISTAQVTDYKFTSLTGNEGLSQNSVYAILHGRRGFMWFGTKDGLNRYDGHSFRIFKHDPRDSTTLADNTVTSIYEDRDGRMWVSTVTALHLYDRRSERFRRIVLTNPSSPGAAPAHVSSITEDSTGTLWLGTTGSGLIRLMVSRGTNPTVEATFFVKDPDNPLSLHHNIITGLYSDGRGKLWIGTVGRLQSLNPYSPEQGFEDHRIQAAGFDVDPHVYSVYEDAKRGLWFGTEAGIGKFDRHSSRVVLYRWGAGEFVGQSKSVRTICEDREGMLWLGTFGRLVYFDPRTERYRTVNPRVAKSSHLFRTGVIQIHRDRSGALWFGTNGHGVFRSDAIHSRFQSFTESTSGVIGWPGHSIRSLFEDSKGRLWIGSYGGVYVANPNRTKFTHVTELERRLIRSIAEDPQGHLWMATYGLLRYDPESGRQHWYRHNPQNPASISSNEVSGVFRDHAGTLWVVTRGVLSRFEKTTGHFTHFPFDRSSPYASNDPVPVKFYQDDRGRIWLAAGQGLLMFDPSTGEFKRYGIGRETTHGLNYSVTLCVVPDPSQPERILWVGTAGGGISRFDIQAEEFKAITEADGLPNNVVYGILGDNGGDLWLSTNRGLARFHPATGRVRTYLVEDGLQSNEYNAGAYYKSARGEMFFGGIRGFDVFDPRRVFENSYNPEIVITRLALFNKPVIVGDTRLNLDGAISEAPAVTFLYEQNVFSLTFTSLDFASPRKNLYRFMLEGFDADFGPVTSNRTATYTNLDPGTYTFRVKGTNSDGVWNEEGAALEIVVLPPFWMTWWFGSFVMVLFLSVGPFIFWRRVTGLKKEREQQANFTRKLIESQEQERKRIAGELHDSLGQNLLVMKNRAVLGLQDRGLARGLREHLTEISETASATLKEVRQISHNLRPYELDRFGLTDALHSVVEKVQTSSAIAFTTVIDTIDNLLSKESEINLYRIVQECLNNIVKHAGATSVEVTVKKTSDGVFVRVRDNGRGVGSALTDGKKGLGFQSLEERVRILGGTISIESLDGRGTTISATIPLALS